MSVTCDIARDLADVYESGKASDETKKAVEKHLNNCSECSEYYAYRRELKTPHLRIETSGADEELISKNLQRLSKRLKTRQIIGTVCAVVTAVFPAAWAPYLAASFACF